MEEKNIYCKPAYKCGICGKTYNSVQERMNCEMACVKKQIEEEKAAKEAKKKAEQKARKEEVDRAFENLQKLTNEYIKDYGHYSYDDSKQYHDFYLPSRILSYFLD